MDKPVGFIEVTVLRDTAVEVSPVEHKATLAVSHIVLIQEEAGQKSSRGGTCIVLWETHEGLGSWVFGDEAAPQPLHRRLFVRESYYLVKWLLETAAGEQRIVSLNDWDKAWSDAQKLTRDIEAPKPIRFKQKHPR